MSRDFTSVKTLLASFGISPNWPRISFWTGIVAFFVLFPLLIISTTFGEQSVIIRVIAYSVFSICIYIFSVWSALEALVAWKQDDILPASFFIWLAFFSATLVPAFLFDNFDQWFYLVKGTIIIAASLIGLFLAFVLSPLLMLGLSAWLLIDGQIGPGLAALLIGVPVSLALVAAVRN